MLTCTQSMWNCPMLLCSSSRDALNRSELSHAFSMVAFWPLINGAAPGMACCTVTLGFRKALQQFQRHVTHHCCTSSQVLPSPAQQPDSRRYHLIVKADCMVSLTYRCQVCHLLRLAEFSYPHDLIGVGSTANDKAHGESK